MAEGVEFDIKWDITQPLDAIEADQVDTLGACRQEGRAAVPRCGGTRYQPQSHQLVNIFTARRRRHTDGTSHLPYL